MPDQPLDVFALPVHPAAEEFPMLPEDELQELADSIGANGLRQPIIVGRVKPNGLDQPWLLLDGRNRREGCRRAEVQPAFEYKEFPTEAALLAYILDLNAHRRHLSKGQLAMAVARVCLETKQPMRDAAKASSLTAGRIAQASTVIQFAPDLVDGVRANTKKLDAAYKAADAESKRDQLERDADARLERKAGQLLREMERNGARQGRGRPPKASTATRLSDLGISRDQASKWQRLACDIRLRAERKAGQLLREREKAKGAPGNQHTGKVDRSNDTTGPKTLADLGN